MEAHTAEAATATASATVSTSLVVLVASAFAVVARPSVATAAHTAVEVVSTAIG